MKPCYSSNINRLFENVKDIANDTSDRETSFAASKWLEWFQELDQIVLPKLDEQQVYFADFMNPYNHLNLAIWEWREENGIKILASLYNVYSNSKDDEFNTNETVIHEFQFSNIYTDFKEYIDKTDS